MRGLFNTPLALSKEPLTAIFWVVLAPIVFLYGAAFFARPFFGDITPGTQSELDAYKTLWLFTCLGMVVWFALMSLWSDWIGAGPFAGAVRAERHWFIIALIAGPLLLLIPNIVASMFMTEEGWQYQAEINEEAFAPTNWSLAYIFIAVIMAPVVEEVTFRGVALGALIARGLSPVGAVVLSSVAFAFIHLQYSPAAMGVVFVTGVGLAVLRLLSGSVGVAIVAHAAANANVLYLTWISATPAT